MHLIQECNIFIYPLIHSLYTVIMYFIVDYIDYFTSFSPKEISKKNQYRMASHIFFKIIFRKFIKKKKNINHIFSHTCKHTIIQKYYRYPISMPKFRFSLHLILIIILYKHLVFFMTTL